MAERLGAAFLTTDFRELGATHEGIDAAAGLIAMSDGSLGDFEHEILDDPLDLDRRSVDDPVRRVVDSRLACQVNRDRTGKR